MGKKSHTHPNIKNGPVESIPIHSYSSTFLNCPSPQILTSSCKNIAESDFTILGKSNPLTISLILVSKITQQDIFMIRNHFSTWTGT